MKISGSNQVVASEAEIRLAVTRDEITNVVKQYDSPAIIARLEYDADAGSTNVNLYLYGKTNGVNTYGTELFHTNGITFATNGTLRLHVTSNSASLVYNGTTYFNSGQHGVDIDAWPDGGVCVVEAEDVDGNTEFAYLDNFKAWRTGASPVQSYEGSFTNAPDGMMLRAWMGDVAIYRNWSTARDTSTYVTNGRVMWLPDASTYGSTWLNARKDFQNELRLQATTEVAEVQIALGDFTQGWMKVGLLPEYFPGGLYNDYESHALYLELERNEGNIKCTVYRQEKAGQNWRVDIEPTKTNTYVDGQNISVQVNTNWIRAYYGSSMIANTNHGLANFVGVYPSGIHPHLEFQSKNTANGAVKLDYLKGHIRADFGTPE